MLLVLRRKHGTSMLVRTNNIYEGRTDGDHEFNVGKRAMSSTALIQKSSWSSRVTYPDFYCVKEKSGFYSVKPQYCRCEDIGL